MEAEESLRRVAEMAIATGKAKRAVHDRLMGQWHRLAGGRRAPRAPQDLAIASADLGIELVKEKAS